MSHEHYFRDVSGLDRIDVYRLLELFGVTCPVAQHVVKKAIAAGQRGHKSIITDWQDIADSAARKLQMIDEDLRMVSEMAADCPDESRRQDDAAEDAPAASDPVSATSPSWSDAPEWAQWLAQDKDGEWWWFDAIPDADGSMWIEGSGGNLSKLASAGRRNASWSKTLESRPVAVPYAGPGGVMIHCPGCDPQICGCRP